MTTMMPTSTMASVTSTATGQAATVGAPEVRVAVQAALAEVHPAIAEFLVLPDLVPWEIRIPDSSETWRMVRERLYPVLRGRPRTAADLAYQFIDFGPIVVRADSMFFTIRAGSESICRISPTDPGFWTSIHSSVQYSAGRQYKSQLWLPAVQGYGGHTDGWCVGPRKPKPPTKARRAP